MAAYKKQLGLKVVLVLVRRLSQNFMTIFLFFMNNQKLTYLFYYIFDNYSSACWYHCSRKTLSIMGYLASSWSRRLYPETAMYDTLNVMLPVYIARCDDYYIEITVEQWVELYIYIEPTINILLQRYSMATAADERARTVYQSTSATTLGSKICLFILLIMRFL